MSTGLNASLSLSLPLTTSVVPVSSAGSSTATFTRATAATVFDWESILKTPISGEVRFQGARRVQNLVGNPEAVNAWTLGNSAVVTTGIADPVGGTSAFQVDLPTQSAAFGGSSSAFAGNGGSIPQNGTGRATAFVRGDSGGTITLSEASAGNYGETLNVTTAWTRISTSNFTCAASGTQLYGFFRKTGDLSRIYIWHPQLENTTGQSNNNPAEYVSRGVLSSPFQGAMVDGVQYFATQNGNTVASNVVTAGTGAAIASSVLLGYLSEEARTNNVIQNRDFTNAAWVKTTMTAAKDQVGIDGTASAASSLLATAGNATAAQTITIAAVNRPFSVYVKRLTGTGNIDLAQDGASFTTQSVANDGLWHRVTLVASQLNPVLTIRLVTNGDKIAVDYAMLEDSGGSATSNNIAGSPIATTTVAVTRNKDVDTFLTSGNVLGTAGTAYAEVTGNASAAVTFLELSSASNRPALAVNASNQFVINDGTTGTTTPALTPSSTPQKIASVWSGSTMKGFVAGVAGTGVAFDGDMNLGASMQIGGGNNGANNINGTIRNVKIWTVALADAQIAGL